MKRAFLVLFSVVAMMVAGATFAQTETPQYGSTDQPATTSAQSTSQTEAQATPSGSTSDPGTTTSRQEGSQADPAPANQNAAHGSLPRTASNQPLLFLIGTSALGGLVGLRLYQLRRAQ